MIKNIGMALLLFAAALLQSFVVISPYKIGDTVDNFSLKNIDGRMVSMDGYVHAKGLIIVFTCNHCPFAKLYQERLNLLNKKYFNRGFPVLAISSNDADAVPEDNWENMVLRAKEKGYTFPYLYDQSQNVARAFGASKTPQAYVVSKENGHWVLKYSGAIDDNGAEPDKAKNKYVENAVNALIQNKPVVVTTAKSVGCGIKWKGGK